MSARDPRFPDIQRRLAALGYYHAGIDDIFGPGMAAGIDEALSTLEAERDAKLALPADTGVKHPDAPAAPVYIYPHLPTAYAWLQREPYLPRHLDQALRLYGTLETAGSGNSPVIMGWRDELQKAGHKIAGYTSDAVPWCGLFIAICMLRAGRDIPDNPLWALNWAAWGQKVGQPELGDVLTFKREGGGHVAFYIAEDTAGYYHVLGGNQSDAVNIMRIAKTRMHSCRQVPYRGKPSNIRPIVVSAAGAPVSRNEA